MAHYPIIHIVVSVADMDSDEEVACAVAIDAKNPVHTLGTQYLR